jgi:hypothetical protein
MQLKSLENIYHINKKSNVAKWFLFTFLAFVFIMFLPWTQNIKTQGNVNTLFQEQIPRIRARPNIRECSVPVSK